MTDYARRSWSAERVAKDRLISKILFACSRVPDSFDWTLVGTLGTRPSREQLLELELNDLHQLMRHLEIIAGPSVMRGYIERDLQGFERQSYHESIMYHDSRDITERSG